MMSFCFISKQKFFYFLFSETLEIKYSFVKTNTLVLNTLAQNKVYIKECLALSVRDHRHVHVLHDREYRHVLCDYRVHLFCRDRVHVHHLASVEYHLSKVHDF